MNFFVFITFVLSICACRSFAAESSGWFKDSAHPGKCVLHGLVLAPGEEAQMPEDCGRIMCGSDSFATVQTCGVHMVPPNCKIVGNINISAPYPDCCEPKVVCN